MNLHSEHVASLDRRRRRAVSRSAARVRTASLVASGGVLEQPCVTGRARAAFTPVGGGSGRDGDQAPEPASAPIRASAMGGSGSDRRSTSASFAAPAALLLARYRDRTLHRATTETPSSSGLPFPAAVTAERIDAASRFGDLGPYLLLDDVTDIVVTGSSGAWVDRGRGFERIRAGALGPADVHALAVRLIAEGGRHVDEVTPFVDVRLGGGIRVHAVLPPLSVGGAALSIRVPASRPLRLDQLEARGMFASREGALARRLREAVRSRTNVLISGGAGTGKTTLLAALLSHADPAERIICVEDVSELVVEHPHVVSLEARQANAEGSGGVDISRLLRESLRMRPDRLVLGECRGSEIIDMLGALNTGHDGGACTVHANSLDDVPTRLESLGALAGMSASAVARQAVSAIGLVVHLRRIDGVRRVTALGRFFRDEFGRLSVAAEVTS